MRPSQNSCLGNISTYTKVIPARALQIKKCVIRALICSALCGVNKAVSKGSCSCERTHLLTSSWPSTVLGAQQQQPPQVPQQGGILNLGSSSLQLPGDAHHTHSLLFFGVAVSLCKPASDEMKRQCHSFSSALQALLLIDPAADSFEGGSRAW